MAGAVKQFPRRQRRQLIVPQSAARSGNAADRDFDCTAVALDLPIFGSQGDSARRPGNSWAVAGVIGDTKFGKRTQRIVIRTIISGTEGNRGRRARRHQDGPGIFDQATLFVEAEIREIPVRPLSGLAAPASSSHSVWR